MRRIAKTYIALVHGNLPKDNVTVNLPIARDLVRRTRMTTRRADGRTAVVTRRAVGAAGHTLWRIHAGRARSA